MKLEKTPEAASCVMVLSPTKLTGSHCWGVEDSMPHLLSADVTSFIPKLFLTCGKRD